MRTTQEILAKAVRAAAKLSQLTTEKKNQALVNMAQSLREHTDGILQENEKDVAAATGTMSAVMLDRLRLNAQRIEEMAQGICDVALLPDP